MKTKVGVYLIFLVSLLRLSAQSDTLPEISDTRNLSNTEEVVRLLIKADSIAFADSISKAVLSKQLEELRSSEVIKRQILEKELKDIRLKDSIQKADMLEEIARLQENAIRYPVIVHKDTLFLIFTKIGAYTPAERADIITKRLQKLYREYFLKSDSLFISDNGQTVDIYFRAQLILSVTELDALWYQKEKMDIALDYKSIILSDIAEFKSDRSFLKLLKEIGLALLVILIQIALIKGINYLFRARINTFLWDKRGIWFKGIKIRNHEILNESRETSAIIFTVKLLRYSIIAILLYLTIPILFSIFPLTQRFAEVMFGYTISPLKRIGLSFIQYIPELITIVVIVVITRYILKFLKFLSVEVASGKLSLPGFFPDWAKPTYNIIKFLILAFMFVVIFPYLPGSDSVIFKGVSVFIGVIFSLGSSSIIGNLVAGLVITYMRPFKIGDMIKIGTVTGNVVEKTPFVTRIRTPKKEFITIPNSNVLSSNVVNYSNSQLQGGLVVHTTVTIGYDAPWRQVHHILINAAKKTSNLNMDIAPFVLQTSLDDFYVSYQLNAHTNEPDKQPSIYSELHQNIQDGFNEEGIEILSPHYRSARDGNPMAVPKDYLPEGYKAPGFKVKNEE